MITVDVGTTLTRVLGANHLAVNDWYQNAPEPPPPNFGGLRTNRANLLYLLDAIPDASWNDPHQKLMEARAMRLIAALRREEPGDYERTWPFKKQPFEHQIKLFAQARHMKMMALAPVALGTGKTKMTLDVAADKFMRGEIDGLGIIAPNGVHRQWVEEAIPSHMSDAVQWRAAAFSTTRKLPADIMTPSAVRRVMRIFSFNVEGFSSDSGKAFKAMSKFLASGNMMLALDESTRIKTPSARRTKAILRLRDLAKVRSILTGTPMTKGLEDIYSQYAFLDPEIIGLSNYSSFRSRYCVTMPAYRGAALGVVKIVGYKNQEELVRKIAPVSFMIPKDVLGLPPQRWERRNVEMTAAQEQLYKLLKEQLIEDLREGRVATPSNAAVRLLRLQQVLCGRYYTREVTEDEIEVEVPNVVESNRIQVLLDVLEEHDGPAVIWARFTPDILDIVAALKAAGKRVCAYYGGIDAKGREDARTGFRDGRYDYFVGNPAAGGTGVDGLQVASLAVYYSCSFNAEHRWQSEGRIHRIGTTESVLYLDLVCPGTVDGLVLKNLLSKGNVAKAVLENPLMLNGGNDDFTS